MKTIQLYEYLGWGDYKVCMWLDYIEINHNDEWKKLSKRFHLVTIIPRNGYYVLMACDTLLSQRSEAFFHLSDRVVKFPGGYRCIPVCGIHINLINND